MYENLHKRVLVVDDDQITIVRVGRALEAAGFLVDSASDGAEAVELIRANDYDVVLLDLLMPRLDGFGVLRFMSEERPDLRARTIVVSALLDDSSNDTNLAGTYGLIAKPVDDRALPAYVRECAMQPPSWRWGT